MAEGLFKQQIAQLGDGAQWQVASAGTWAEDYRPAMSLACTTMAEQGIDLNGHRSRLLDGAMLQEADIILVMTRHHLEAIRAEFPEIAERTYLMSQLIDQTFDIDDPVQGTLDDYRRCAADLKQILSNGYARLVELTDQAVLNRST